MQATKCFLIVSYCIKLLLSSLNFFLPPFLPSLLPGLSLFEPPLPPTPHSLPSYLPPFLPSFHHIFRPSSLPFSSFSSSLRSSFPNPFLSFFFPPFFLSLTLPHLTEKGSIVFISNERLLIRYTSFFLFSFHGTMQTSMARERYYYDWRNRETFLATISTQLC